MAPLASARNRAPSSTAFESSIAIWAGVADALQMVHGHIDPAPVVLDAPSYQAPFPRSGVEGYPAWRTAQAAGAAGETDGEGRIMRTCVVPNPYQKPHPPVMVPTTKSVESIEFCARRGFIPVHFTPLPGVVEATRIYNEIAARQGVSLRFGARQNLCRFPHIAPSGGTSGESVIQRLF